MVYDLRPPRDTRFLYPEPPECIAHRQDACNDVGIDLERIKRGGDSDGSLLIFVSLIEEAWRDALAPQFFAAALSAEHTRSAEKVGNLLEHQLDNLRSIAAGQEGDLKQADSFCLQIYAALNAAMRPIDPRY